MPPVATHDPGLAAKVTRLALECGRLGAPWAAAPVAFCQTYRASLRATIAFRHLDDDGVAAKAAWIVRALD